jgi:F-box and WD-40 domain protein 1/11
MNSHSMSPYDDPSGGPFPSSASAASFRLDEGFSEDTPSQDENNRVALERLQEWIMSQSEENRMDIAYEILRTLRTSNIAAVVERLTPHLHMDPLEKLPPEISSEIFAYLDAQTLLTASLCSRNWRETILDTRLWQQQFEGQGWGVESKELRSFENSLLRDKSRNRRGKSRVISGDTAEQPQLKKRATSDLLETNRRQPHVDLPNWGEQHGAIEIDSDVAQDNSDQEMVDAPSSVHASPQRRNKRHSQDSSDEMDYYPGPSNSTLAQLGTGRNEFSPSKPRLTYIDEKGEERLNWAYLYKQRHRLEDNWLQGRYKTFQLPDPAYPQEAHTECVYCIQFFGKWLVSGSRDKTLRVWDLETRRLRGRPLVGHSQSVLCLQFDPSEGEDIIISGSSDSSVIVWKFSTGQKLHEIVSAHDESVLNLRFDKRFLVTCSKDKKIKVWNRHQLAPNSPDFPRVKAGTEGVRAPTHIIDLGNMEPSMLEAGLANGTLKPIRAWSHLLTFVGHGAAVNAIQILGDQIVSASGDRLIKVWNVLSGKMVKSIPGHLKGIACVQFDDKRVVSGSSDNTVRIFDLEAGTEVAELKGHTNLVRTVQAGFADLPGCEPDYAAQAREAEHKFQRDVESGRLIDDRAYSRRLRAGEFGSSRTSFGSKLPPGGGGSKWGKIVSGSYDESIIIWRKNPQGDWVVGQTLRQENNDRPSRRNRHGQNQAQPAPQPALAAPGPVPPVVAAVPPPVPPQPPNSAASTGTSTPLPNTHQAALQAAAQAAASSIMNQAVNYSVSSLGAGLSNVMGIARNLNRQSINVPPRSSSGGNTSSSSTVIPTPTSSAAADSGSPWGSARLVNGSLTTSYNMSLTRDGQPSRSQSGSHTINLTDPQTPAEQTTSTPANPPAPTQGGTSTAEAPQLSEQPSEQQASTHAPVAAAAPVPVQAPVHVPPASVSRVFKLQFDARRLVCCSQDSRIIGWDFANGDAEIMESSKFFVGP